MLQPPLPLQEFWPLQPLSLDLQPPVPLQEFWPLQSCLPASLDEESPLPAAPSAFAPAAEPKAYDFNYVPPDHGANDFVTGKDGRVYQYMPRGTLILRPDVTVNKPGK